MDEKQKKQLEIIHNALTTEQCDILWDLSKKLKSVGQDIVKELSAYDILQGNSEKMLAANAVMQISKQIDIILTCDE